MLLYNTMWCISITSLSTGTLTDFRTSNWNERGGSSITLSSQGGFAALLVSFWCYQEIGTTSMQLISVYVWHAAQTKWCVSQCNSAVVSHRRPGVIGWPGDPECCLYMSLPMMKIADFYTSFLFILKDCEMVQRVEINIILPSVKTVTVCSTVAMQRAQRIPPKNLGAITNREKPLSATFG